MKRTLALALAAVLLVAVGVGIGGIAFGRSAHVGSPKSVTDTAATTPSASTMAVATSTKVSQCGVIGTVEKPSSLTMVCGDAGVIEQHLDWRYWGPDVAIAVGSSEENDCDPDCADGTTVPIPSTVVL